MNEIAQRQRAIRALVWSVWVIMLIIAAGALARDGRNLPLTEDWQLVPALTGNESEPIVSLLAQNNEHRVPLPKLLILAVLTAAGGDFRAGMALTIVLIAGVAAGSVLVARRLRGGVTEAYDACLPIILLNPGHAENLYWSWQLTLVLPTLMTCVLLLAIVGEGVLHGPARRMLVGTMLIGLPMCGMNGVLFALALAPWFMVRGLLARRADAGGGRDANWLIVGASTSLLLACLYFVGYERPSWMGASADVVTSVRAALQFTGMALGPAVRRMWTLGTLAALLLTFPSVAIAARAAATSSGEQRLRAIGVTVYIVATMLFAVGIGHARGGVVATIFGEWPTRYAMLAAPALLACFFTWQLYGTPTSRRGVGYAVLASVVLLLPFNAVHGDRWLDQFREPHEAFLRELANGHDLDELAQRYRGMLGAPMSPESLARGMRMMRDAGIGPFAGDVDEMDADPTATRTTLVLPETRPADEIERAAPTSVDDEEPARVRIGYVLPGVTRVTAAWGVDGWRALESHIRPPGTWIRDGIMHTPMRRVNGSFEVELTAPVGSTIDVGFQVTHGVGGVEFTDIAGVSLPIWDGRAPSGIPALDGAAVTVESMMSIDAEGVPILRLPGARVPQEIRYHAPRADEVLLAWGVDDWMAIPAEQRPPDTTIRNGRTMLTPMSRDGDEFVITLELPAGTRVGHGFMITDERGVVDLIRPIWDGRPAPIVVGSGVVRLTTAAEFPSDLRDLLLGTHISWSTILRLLTIWLAVWLAIWWLMLLLSPSAPHRPTPAGSGQSK